MAITEQWHHLVDASFGGAENYHRGIYPNPWVGKHPVLARRKKAQGLRESITRKIEMLFSPRFITSIETCEMLEALVSMTSSRSILELGTHTGFGALHMLRAIAGDDGAKLVSIDARPAHDREFFTQPEISNHFEFIEGWTPDAIPKDRIYNFVFVDSDHSVEHTQKELNALMPVTQKGSIICFHDCPEWRTPSIREAPPVRTYLQELIDSPRGEFNGMILPSPEQMDCVAEYGSGYPDKCNPGLAILVRK